MQKTDVYIALGSNMGTPVNELRCALRALSILEHTTLVTHSVFYQNPPMGPIPQNSYVNAVAHVRTSLSPEALLTHLHAIERQQGRERTIHWGPRILDLDLILYGNHTQSTPALTLPHPGLYARNFVLIPLADIAPSLILPSGSPITAYITPKMYETLHPIPETMPLSLALCDT